MGAITQSYTFAAGVIPTATNFNANPAAIIALLNGNLDEANVDLSGNDGLVGKSTTQTIAGRKTFTGGVVVNELLALDAAGAGVVELVNWRFDPASGTVSDNDGGYFSNTYDNDAATPEEIEYVRTGFRALDVSDGTEKGQLYVAAADGVDGSLDELLTLSKSALTLSTPLTVGVDDTGYDVKFFGATTLKYWEWDESADQMNVAGTVSIVGALTLDGDLGFTGPQAITTSSGNLTINPAGDLIGQALGVFELAGDGELRIGHSTDGEAARLSIESSSTTISAMKLNVTGALADAKYGIYGYTNANQQESALVYLHSDNASSDHGSYTIPENGEGAVLLVRSDGPAAPITAYSSGSFSGNVRLLEKFENGAFGTAGIYRFLVETGSIGDGDDTIVITFTGDWCVGTSRMVASYQSGTDGSLEVDSFCWESGAFTQSSQVDLGHAQFTQAITGAANTITITVSTGTVTAGQAHFIIDVAAQGISSVVYNAL